MHVVHRRPAAQIPVQHMSHVVRGGGQASSWCLGWRRVKAVSSLGCQTLVDRPAVRDNLLWFGRAVWELEISKHHSNRGTHLNRHSYEISESPEPFPAVVAHPSTPGSFGDMLSFVVCWELYIYVYFRGHFHRRLTEGQLEERRDETGCTHQAQTTDHVNLR